MFYKSCLILFTVILTTLFFVSCSEKVSECEKHKVIVGQYYEGINMGIRETSELIIHDHFVKYVNGKKKDKYGPIIFLEEIGENAENNIDYIYKIEEMISEANKIVVMWEWRSTNIQFGLPIDISLHGVSIFEFEDTKIKKLNEIFDEHNYFLQLGYKYILPETDPEEATE